MLNKIRC